MRTIVRDDSNFSSEGSDEFPRQREIHVPLNRRERLADRLNHGSEHSRGKRFLLVETNSDANSSNSSQNARGRSCPALPARDAIGLFSETKCCDVQP